MLDRASSTGKLIESFFKYLTVVFFIGKEGMRSGPSRFRRGEGPPLPSPTPILDRGDAVHGMRTN